MTVSPYTVKKTLPSPRSLRRKAMGFMFGAVWVAWILFMLFSGFGD